MTSTSDWVAAAGVRFNRLNMQYGFETLVCALMVFFLVGTLFWEEDPKVGSLLSSGVCCLRVPFLGSFHGKPTGKPPFVGSFYSETWGVCSEGTHFGIA